MATDLFTMQTKQTHGRCLTHSSPMSHFLYPLTLSRGIENVTLN